jgi:putative addiction module component (TIGR02574 family)
MLAIDNLFNEISTLKPVDRIKLVERILTSLNSPNKEIDKIWEEEIENRIKAYKNGKLKTVSASKVFSKYTK